MANREVDITAETDDDEIEVVVVERVSVQPQRAQQSSRQEAIDLTVLDVKSDSCRPSSRESATSSISVIDLYSNSDDDVTVLLPQKLPATPATPFRYIKLPNDVEVVESPRKARNMLKASPKVFGQEKDSNLKKRAHTDVSLSASVVVDLTDLEDDSSNKKARQKAPPSLSPALIQKPLHSVNQTSISFRTSQPKTIDSNVASLDGNVALKSMGKKELSRNRISETIDSKVASLHGNDALNSMGSEDLSLNRTDETIDSNVASQHGNDASNSMGVEELSRNVKAGGRSTSSSSSYHRKESSHSEEKKSTPSTVMKATPSSSVEATTSRSYDDDKSYSENYDTSDSESTLSFYSDRHQNQKNKSKKVVAPIGRSLRPRVGGKAIIKRHSVSLTKGDSEVDTKSIRLVKAENGGMTTDSSAIVTIKRSPRASKTEATLNQFQQVKACDKRQKCTSTAGSILLPSHLKNVDDKKVFGCKRDQITDQLIDSESADDCSSSVDDESTASPRPSLNTDKDQEASSIRLNWGSLSSRSSYQHYCVIDDMIVMAKKQNNEAAESLQLVRAGESRFFASRYAKHKADLIQWVTYTQQKSAQLQPLQPHYLSIYLPYNAVIKQESFASVH